jgi:ABC-2 type transport system ATP-binding protein
VSKITVVGSVFMEVSKSVLPNIVKEEKKMNKNIIQLKGIKKAYKEVEVLKGVDLEVEQGGVFALLGSNGAGKTTMIRIMATLLKADSGSVVINGYDISKNPGDIRGCISLTGQFAAIDEILTGRENLQMIAKLRHLKNPNQVADELIRRFSMSEAADRRVSTYSGGMKRRIDIAMSLVGNPKIIFLDEPTTGLDPEARLEVWKLVKELSMAGTTVFLTTQYLEEAEQLADKIAILHGGRIIALDTLTGLKKLFPPAKVEYVEKQPTLEEIFLAIIGKKEDK